jgi:ATP-binding cassette, subfamily C, bacterial CydC
VASHDVAFRILADIRVAIYRRLERLAPAGLAAFRSGDLLARLISDVDAARTCSSGASRRRWPPGSSARAR